MMTKKDIEDMAMEVVQFLKQNDMANDVCIYYNNKRWSTLYTKLDTGEWSYQEVIQDNMNPFDYFEYANDKHILSMSFEGTLYDLLNYYAGRLYDEFAEIFNKRGLYYEFGNAWNLSVYPDDDYDGIEYTSYEPEPEPEYIYHGKADVLPELRGLMDLWWHMSKDTGDRGGCVIGAGMCFTYKGKSYKMAPCSPYQGELSWTPHVEFVKETLKNIGAEDIYWNCGRLD